MHLYYCAGINSQSFAGAGGSGHTYCGSGRECNTYVAGAGGNGQKFGGRGRERDEENSPAQCSTVFPVSLDCAALRGVDWLSVEMGRSERHSLRTQMREEGLFDRTLCRA